MMKVGDLLGVGLILIGLYILIEVMTTPKSLLLQIIGFAGSLVLIIVESVFIFEKLKGGS